MKITVQKLIFPLIAFLAVLAFPSCVNQDFDEPPANGEIPSITPNATVSDVRALHTLGQLEEITDDLILEVVVAADDASGNFYKTLVVQDATGGLELRINETDLYNEFPIGRQLFIYCQGLHLGDYNGVTQLGGGTYVNASGEEQLASIESLVLDEVVIGGSRNNEITPTTKTINELGQSDISTLVRLNDIELASSDAGSTYADAINQFSENLDIQDCDGNTIVLRSSGYADFAAETTPIGNGSITAIYSVFGTTKQLYIRNTNDVNMNDTRCDGGTGGTGNESLITIADLRSNFSGIDTNAPADTKIKGEVISDYINANFQGRNLIIQDVTGGITVRFDNDHSFAMGTELEIIISGQELSEFNGLLQVNNVPLLNASATGNDEITITPTVVTVAELTGANYESYESTLVSILGGTMSGNATYNGVLEFTDATGTIDVFTRSAATFSGDAAPTNGENVDIIGIASEFSNPTFSPQLNIRSTADVTADGGGGGGGCEIDQDFSTGTDGQEINLAGWTSYVAGGTNEPWIFTSFSGDRFAECEGYQAATANVESWLISPSINTSSVSKTISFSTAKAFWSHTSYDPLEVKYSTDFDGANVNTATWTTLSGLTLATDADGNYDKVPSGTATLPTGSNVYVAFIYKGDNTTNTTKIRVDDVQVCE